MFQIIAQNIIYGDKMVEAVGRAFVVEQNVAKADIEEALARAKGRFPGMIVCYQRVA